MKKIDISLCWLRLVRDNLAISLNFGSKGQALDKLRENKTPDQKLIHFKNEVFKKTIERLAYDQEEVVEEGKHGELGMEQQFFANLPPFVEES